MHELYAAGDGDTVNKYQHLFIRHQQRDPSFVVFQQAVLKDKVASCTEEQLLIIDEFIDKHYEEQRDRQERPWSALKVEDAQSDADLERQYIEQ